MAFPTQKSKLFFLQNVFAVLKDKPYNFVFMEWKPCVSNLMTLEYKLLIFAYRYVI